MNRKKHGSWSVAALHTTELRWSTHAPLRYVQGTFLFGMVWSIGASVGVMGRKAFDLLLREIIDGPLLPKTKSDTIHLYITRNIHVCCCAGHCIISMRNVMHQTNHFLSHFLKKGKCMIMSSLKRGWDNGCPGQPNLQMLNRFQKMLSSIPSLYPLWTQFAVLIFWMYVSNMKNHVCLWVPQALENQSIYR